MVRIYEEEELTWSEFNKKETSGWKRDFPVNGLTLNGLTLNGGQIQGFLIQCPQEHEPASRIVERL